MCIWHISTKRLFWAENAIYKRTCLICFRSEINAQYKNEGSRVHVCDDRRLLTAIGKELCRRYITKTYTYAECCQPGRVAVGHLTRKSGVLGSIPGLATYFRFSFRFFKKGSCQLLAKVCARSTG